MSASNHNHPNEHAPLNNLDEWEDDPGSTAQGKQLLNTAITTLQYGVT